MDLEALPQTIPFLVWMARQWQLASFLLKLCLDILEVLVERVYEYGIVSILDNWEQIVLADKIVLIHVVQLESKQL